MKNIFLVFLLLGFSVLAISQTYFNHRYNLYYPDGLDYAYNIIEYDSGYIVAGGIQLASHNYRSKVVLSKLNFLGELLYSKVIEDDIWGYDFGYTGCVKYVMDEIIAVGARRKPSGSFVIDEGVIYKFTEDFDTIFTKIIGDIQLPNDTTYQFRHLEVLPSNDLVILGAIVVSGETSKAILIKTDSLGNEQWRKYFFNGPLNSGVNVIQTPDKGYAISCYLWTFGTHQIAAPYIVKTDSMGNEQWRHYIDWVDQRHGPMYLQNSADNTIVGAYSYSDSVSYPSNDSFNRDALIKIDLVGNVLYDKKYNKMERNKWTMSVSISDNGRIIITGYKFSPFSHRVGYMLNTNNEGDSLWYREYENLFEYESNNYLYGVESTTDGGYVAVGAVSPYPPDTGNHDVWVIKVDSLGCESWDMCWTGVKEQITLREAQELKIYPNPTASVVVIYIPKENESENHKLIIFDMYGHKIKETDIPPHETEKQIDVSSWNSGLYSVITYNKGKLSGRGKFVVK